MKIENAGKEPLRDYSLVGLNAELAVQKGLVDAAWYTSPVPKQKMRQLLHRRDGPALRDTLLWFALLCFFGGAGFWLWGSLWSIFPFAIYGVLYASVSDSRWHESSHGTAFKTDWMNNVLYEIASFMVMRESVLWRWSHNRHHSDTLVVGRDPEISAQRPIQPLNLLMKFFNLLAFRMYARNLVFHSLGILLPEERTYLPDSEVGKVFIRARIYLLIYTSVIGMAIYWRNLLPLMFIGLPNIYGSWLMVVYGLTQHAGLAENVLDHRLNCRTVYMNRINRFLYWNMGYHTEHHMFPLVPYHALPELHEAVKADMPTPYRGLLDAYREIIPALRRQVIDATYYIKRQLPPPANREALLGSSSAIPLSGSLTEDGWLEICQANSLQQEDVLRFDFQSKTYALYCTAENMFYSTEGLCTHGNSHLADGMVKGQLIECAKHNGRFDVRDGSPQRLPVCIGLKTYPVRQRNGKLQVNLHSAGGFGVTQAAPVLTFKVVSNHNVATFIKELALESIHSEELPKYQPGDYLQINIPEYAMRTFKEVDVRQPFVTIWEAHGIFDLSASNPSTCRRNYSLASNPARDVTLFFNVRLATPPKGLSCSAGVGSSYIFNLKPGDIVTAIGPFGQFHIKESDREVVYLGGGAGMAPLRSHISYLLETVGAKKRISYWYGARSLQELFYQDYFEHLAHEHSNFSFHVALSESLPEDQWQSHTGFIHEILKSEYLDLHPNPQDIDYYLCGPPMMIQAANNMLKELGVELSQIFFDEF